jgi:hypothetical protein
MGQNLQSTHMSEIDKLREKIQNIHMKIEKMHVTAWRHRVDKNIPALHNVHVRIGATKRELTECELHLEELVAKDKIQDSAAWFCFVVTMSAVIMSAHIEKIIKSLWFYFNTIHEVRR